jgi:hypothetical protein
MNVFEQSKQSMASVLSSPLAMILIISTLLWATGAPMLTKHADAAQVTQISDTLYDSDLGVASKHILRYTTASSTPAGGTIQFIFDPTTSAFGMAGPTATTTQITAIGMTVVTTCGGGSDEVTVSTNYTAGSEGFTLTVCGGDSVPAGAKVINYGATSSPIITNPASAGSYRVNMVGSNGDVGATRIAIIDDVVVTAAVDTTFTFTVAGVATSTVVNGETTTGSTTATAINYNYITPGSGGAQVMGQYLSVITNAAYGFSVTVREDTNLLSSTGADIDLFKDGATTSVPTAWTSPTNTLGSEWTYGHFGVTSQDTTLSAGDEFGSSLFAGNIDTPRQVFYHNGPSDGTTDDIGDTFVAYKVEIGSLQEAGTDYTNTLTYVATPVF